MADCSALGLMNQPSTTVASLVDHTAMTIREMFTLSVVGGDYGWLIPRAIHGL